MIHPHKFYHGMRWMIRSLMAGGILTALAGAWSVWLVSSMDLGEFSKLENTFITILVVGTILTILFVQDFLFVRALGMILLLGACILLDAAFPVEQPLKIVVVLLAYFWIVAGMVFVTSPYLLRELLRMGYKDSVSSRVLNGLGGIIGIILVVLAFTAYSGNP
jgi:hypothetical protein